MKKSKNCMHCGDKFTSRMKDPAFCLETCKQKASLKATEPEIKPMSTHKFCIPKCLLKVCVDHMNKYGIKSTITSINEDVFHIEVAYSKEHAYLIAKMEEDLNTLYGFALGSVVWTAILEDAAKKIQNKEEESFTSYLNTLINNGIKK